MIFSGPLQPAILGSLVACVELHLSDEIKKLQNELMELIHYFRQYSSELGIPIVTRDDSPIQLLRTGNLDLTYRILKKLIENGFFAMAVGYPAIAQGDEGIRITLTRHLTKTDIKEFLENLKTILLAEKIIN
jgi:7-keto-8-aminopelargonate synthetase-like enzyme